MSTDFFKYWIRFMRFFLFDICVATILEEHR